MQDWLSNGFVKAYLVLGLWFWVVSVVVLVRRWREREQATSTNKLTIPRQVTRRAFALIGALVVVVGWLPVMLWYTAEEVFPEWVDFTGTCGNCGGKTDYRVRADKLDEGFSGVCGECQERNFYSPENMDDPSD